MNNRNLFYIFIALLVICTGWWAWTDLYVNGNKIDIKKKELSKLAKKFKDLEEVQDSYGTVKEYYETVLTDFDTLKGFVLSNQDDYILLLEQIRAIAQKQNVRLLTLSPIRTDSFPAIKRGLKVSGKHIERFPVQIKLLGDFLTIGMFLEEILSVPYQINIGRVSMETELEGEGILACELILYTYMYQETI